jgi:hypothetical protein
MATGNASAIRAALRQMLDHISNPTGPQSQDAPGAGDQSALMAAGPPPQGGGMRGALQQALAQQQGAQGAPAQDPQQQGPDPQREAMKRMLRQLEQARRLTRDPDEAHQLDMQIMQLRAQLSDRLGQGPDDISGQGDQGGQDDQDQQGYQ